MFTRRLGRVAMLATCLALLATGLTAVTASADQHAAQTGDPFSSLDVFCTKSTAPPGTRNSSSPGVTPNSITISDNSLDTDALRRIGNDQMNFHQALTAFVDLINECGGVNGRKIVLKTALYNVLAPDLAGHVQANCIKITEDQKAFMTLGITSITNARCVTVQHKTIMNAPAYQTVADFRDSQGRLVSIYPASDRLASAFIADGMAQQAFKGRKVTILGTNLPATRPADIVKEYEEPLKAKGIDVNTEILPCTGAVCTGQASNAIRRLKANGTNLIIVDHNFPGAGQIGTVVKEMQGQGLKAALTGVDTDSLFSDSQMTSIQRNAGTDGVAWMDKYGLYAVGMDPNLQRGGWRSGQVLESRFAKMCTATLAKALGQRRYNYDVTDIGNARWQGTVNLCGQARQMARALYKLGNNVTTARMIEALRGLDGASVARDTAPAGTDKWLFVWPNVSPTGASTNVFNYPCPLPTRQTTGCMLPQDKPIRTRKIKG
ncbi:MAG: hypothetical protein JWN67_1449 [Actinomycetia bacterium]|nr:hypothetical protein [Actinomycetes bacterium]